MKVKYLVLLLLFINQSIIFSQQEQRELFKQALRQKTVIFMNEPNFNKAQSFFLEKNWDSSLVYAMKQLNENNKEIKIIDYCHYFRGYSLRKKKVYDEAKRELSRISKDFDFLYHAEMVLGEIALEELEFEKALTCFKKIETINENNIIGLRKNNIEHNIGLCYMYLEEYDNAETYLLKSLRFQEQTKDTLEMIGAYMDFANLYYVQYKDELAIPYFEKAYHLAKKKNDFKLKQKTAFNMSIVEEDRKNITKALLYRKEYEQWVDSLNNQNNIWKTAEFEKQFAIAEKQKEVIQLEAEKKIATAKQKRFLYAAVFLLLLLGFGFYFYREKVKSNTIIMAQKEELNELNVAKDKLFSIVSHDLRSSVNALKNSNKQLSNNLEAKNLEVVSGLLHQNSTIVNGAYNLLDNILHWALLQTQQSYFGMKVLPLSVIVAHVAHNYVPFMKDKSLVFKNEVNQEAMVYADQESLKIILRNLLDNAIKFSNTTDCITISTEDTSTYYNLIVADTGLGMDTNKIEELLKDTALLSKKDHEDKIGTGLGIQLCKSMIKRNKGQFFIESELGKGTKMIVSLLKTPPHGAS